VEDICPQPGEKAEQFDKPWDLLHVLDNETPISTKKKSRPVFAAYADTFLPDGTPSWTSTFYRATIVHTMQVANQIKYLVRFDDGQEFEIPAVVHMKLSPTSTVTVAFPGLLTGTNKASKHKALAQALSTLSNPARTPSPAIAAGTKIKVPKRKLDQVSASPPQHKQQSPSLQSQQISKSQPAKQQKTSHNEQQQQQQQRQQQEEEQQRKRQQQLQQEQERQQQKDKERKEADRGRKQQLQHQQEQRQREQERAQQERAQQERAQQEQQQQYQQQQLQQQQLQQQQHQQHQLQQQQQQEQQKRYQQEQQQQQRQQQMSQQHNPEQQQQHYYQQQQTMDQLLQQQQQLATEPPSAPISFPSVAVNLIAEEPAYALLGVEDLAICEYSHLESRAQREAQLEPSLVKAEERGESFESETLKLTADQAERRVRERVGYRSALGTWHAFDAIRPLPTKQMTVAPYVFQMW
jgi:hypothetical protein